MRLWTIHPKYLDQKGLLALWREGLLAQKVLCGETKGYKNHPQLDRFKKCSDPIGAIGYYLYNVALEASKRGYNFDRSKIRKQTLLQIPVTSGQAKFELFHLLRKLRERDPNRAESLEKDISPLAVVPLFKLVEGAVESWEKV